ncbi:hypothetical protein GCM10027275_24790 [Rhabdobacter roseus]|uniref:Uncharacterized protein n=1 Tax=Rhabdobacter roseus TaxID=1655419 RepID=A0A840TXP5_9BACT|nr:hypothetical protein [Rhabdobacter roseus]MBB5284419.1 hypothetical protein [Rhabdobacter roseus]
MALTSTPKLPEANFERIKSDDCQVAYNFFRDGQADNIAGNVYKLRFRASGVQALEKTGVITNSRVVFALTGPDKSTLSAGEYQLTLVQILAGGVERTLCRGTLSWYVSKGGTFGMIDPQDITLNFVTASQELIATLGIVDLGTLGSTAAAAQAGTYAQQALDAKVLVEQKITEANTLAVQVSQDKEVVAGDKVATQQAKSETLAIYQQALAVSTQARVFKDEYNAGTNTPNLSTITKAAGDFYKVSVPGTTTITGGSIAAKVGDEFTWNGTKWVHTPASDDSSGKIASLEERFLASKNLFNQATLSASGNFIHGGTGVVTAGASYAYSDYIPVTPGNYYGKGVIFHPGATGVGDGMRHVAFYNASKVFVSGGYDAWTKTVMVPEGVAFVRISITVGNADTFQFEAGNAASSYVPYSQKTLGSTLVPAEAVKQDTTHRLVTDAEKTAWSAKLGDGDLIHETVPASKNLFDQSAATIGFFIHGGTGTVTSNAQYAYSDYLPVAPGSYYGKGAIVQAGSSGLGDGMRHIAFYNASKVFVAGGYDAWTKAVTIPAGVAFVRISISALNLDSFQFEAGNAATDYVPFYPERNILTKIKTFELSQPQATLPDAGRRIGLMDVERVLVIGDSYSESYSTLVGKSYLAVLSMYSDWNVENYAKSGDDYDFILTRIKNNDPTYKGVGIKSFTGGGYAFLISFTNDNNKGVINSTDQLNNYVVNLKKVMAAVKALGYRPVICTEYHNINGANGGALVQAVLSQVAAQEGAIFADVYEKTRYLRGSDYAPFWEGSHPGPRTCTLFWANLLPYLKSLPRPKWGIKIYRKRDAVAVATVADLRYTDPVERARKFKEILVTQRAIATDKQNYYDALPTWYALPTGRIQTVGEYLDLMLGSTLAMPDYALLEFVINATAATTKKLRLFVGSTTATVYLFNRILNQWDAVANQAGFVTLTNLQDYLEYDKVSVLLHQVGGFNLAAPYLEFTGVEGKDYYARPLPQELRTSELLTTRNFNAGTTGWTVTGALAPFVPTDGARPTGITQVVPVSAGNYPSQTVTFSAAAYKRKAQLKVIARRNPPIFDYNQPFPGSAPITLDTYDNANVRLHIVKGTNNATFRELIGLHWTEAVFEFDLAAGDTTFTFSIMRDDADYELADVSLKIE